MWFALIIVLIIVVVVAAVVIKSYNGLVTKRNKVKNSWAHIDAQLQRRFDLVPNLVAAVKGFAIHEHKILNNVTALLDKYMSANTNQEKFAVDAQLTTYLKSLYNVAGRYPQLKSDEHFLQLQSALTEIEEDISYARQFYNDAVTIYNNALMTFPNSMIASKFGFKEEQYFDAVKAAEAPLTIDLRYATRHECPICGAVVGSDDIDCKYCGCSLVN